MAQDDDVDKAGTPGALSGPLGEGVIPALLKEIYLARRTGLLSFVRDWERRSVRFVNGNIVHAETNAPGGHLGDLMVRHGLLGREELSRALALARSSGKRLGLVLSEQGLVDKDLLDDAALLHVVDTLVKVFSWREGSHDFEDQPVEAFKDYDLTLKVSTGDMILKAVRGIEDADVIRYWLGDLDRALVLATDPLLRFQRVELSATDAFILSRVDGFLSAADIVRMAPVSPEEAQRTLFGLLCTGLVCFADAVSSEEAPGVETLRAEILEEHRQQASRSHFEVLGVSRTAGDAELRTAYLRLTRRYHPDIQYQPGLTDLKQAIEALFARVCEAYKLLSDSRQRAAYESVLSRSEQRVPQPAPALEPAAHPPDPLAEQQRADELMAEAEALFAQQKYWDALQHCEDLLPLARGKTRRRARVLLAECYLKNPNWQRQAEDELLGAIQEDGGNAEACLLLGRLYKQAGLPTRAAAMFRKVLELRPRHAAATQELVSLPGVANEAERGLLKKLFG